jgi:hypothetical protein
MTARAIATLLVLAASATSYAGGVERDGAADLRAARERERVARLALEAARTGQFTLVADAGASRLTLSLSGVPLATYRVERIDLGLPPSDGTASGDELSELYRCRAPSLHPPNEIRPGDAVPADPVAGEPTGPRETTPPIGRVAVECDSSLSVRLVSSADLDLADSLRDRLRLPGEPPAAARVRIVLPPEEAERLFASLPAKVLFFVSRLPVPAAAATAPPR